MSLMSPVSDTNRKFFFSIRYLKPPYRWFVSGPDLRRAKRGSLSETFCLAPPCKTTEPIRRLLLSHECGKPWVSRFDRNRRRCPEDAKRNRSGTHFQIVKPPPLVESDRDDP